MRIVVYALGLAAAWSLKAYYSSAGADDLNWILAPTCRLAGWLGDIPFQREAGTGWVSHPHRMIVGPACAGLNFLIIAFCAYHFTLVHRFARPAARLVWLPASLAAAAAVTIPANALRIIVATHLHAGELAAALPAWLTPQRAHRAAGAIVFCAALAVSYAALDRMVRGSAGPRSVLAPIGCYLGVALGVPLLNGGWRQDPALFFEHAAVVAAAGAAAGAAWIALMPARGRATETG